MKLHHSKHHQTYVNGFNAAEEQLQNAFKANDLTKQLSLQNALKFNGGGHINHTLFWQNLAPNGKGGGSLPKGALASAITKEFGSFEDFQKQFNTAAAGVQGK
jgi:Fe-Mn family superoxide dismutase